jgi:chromosome segregation ATPase
MQPPSQEQGADVVQSAVASAVQQLMQQLADTQAAHRDAEARLQQAHERARDTQAELQQLSAQLLAKERELHKAQVCVRACARTRGCMWKAGARCVHLHST